MPKITKPDEQKAGPHGTIVTCETGRPDLLGFEVLAKIEHEDIEWMARHVEAAFALLDEVDMIMIMRNYEGAEVSAVFNAKALKAQADSVKHVRKYAVVGAPVWAKAMITMLSPLSPVDAKTFELNEAGQAWAWVNAVD